MTHVAGEDCYLVKVKTADAEALGQLLREKIGALKDVTSTKTTVVLQTVKETTVLPLDRDQTVAEQTTKLSKRKQPKA